MATEAPWIRGVGEWYRQVGNDISFALAYVRTDIDYQHERMADVADGMGRAILGSASLLERASRREVGLRAPEGRLGVYGPR